MGSLSNYAEQALVKHLFRESAYTPAATLYLALCTADPGEAATGASMSEVANSGGYARTAIAFGAAASRRVTQSGAVTFPTASGSWTYQYWAIVDSATHGAGNVLASGSFSASKSVVSGNTPSVASGEIWVELTASTGLSNYAANGFLDRMFRNQAFTVSANYAGLATAVLADTTTGGTVTEVSGGSYARVAINASGGGSPAWGAASGGAVSNADAVSFPAATGSWGTVVAMFIADASSAGNILWYDNGLVDQAVTSGDTCSWASSQLAFSQA
jgi:hypothetical protein